MTIFFYVWGKKCISDLLASQMIDRRNLEKYSGKRKESSPLKKGGGIFSRDVLNV